MRNAALVSALAALWLGPSFGQTPATTEIEIQARKYEFTPAAVEVAAGSVVRFKVTALDREHGFEIEGVKDSCVKIKKGETATIEYRAEKSGTVEFRCCTFCGMGHRRMKGSIVVK
jgi:heme/copper-type cytochrome/quinol oxidase subunit 2